MAFIAAAKAIVLALGAVKTAAGAITIAGSALLGSIAVGAVAAGLAIGTSKILGLGPPRPGEDPGLKIQLPPSTDNKVPRMYGRNYTGGTIIDAEIKNSNKTMAYALVISEYNSNDVWTVNSIYRGDAQLFFNAANVISMIDPNATSSTNIANKMRVRVYAGGSAAANQIFPTTNKVNAYGGTNTSKSGQFLNWTAANTMTDLVFAVVEMDYDAENDLVGLGAITFDINNALNEPSNVLLDYLRNDRYGAGISNTIIDTASFNNWYNYADANVSYIDTSNVTLQHSRYQIDGALSTFNSVIQNIGKICLSGGAFFTYNAKQGKFGVVVNRAASNTELANAFVFSDDNILGSISITSTDLFNVFNQIEIEYPSVNQRDQTDTYFAEIDPSIRNSNEPDNKLSYRLDMVNDRTRVGQLANVDLNQSRINTIIELTADHSSMIVDVGDVVKLTLPLYGYNEKLFRTMKVSEDEGDDGTLSFKFTLLEYDADVYDDLLTQEDLPLPVTGITNWWVLNSNAVLTIGNITIVNDPTSANAQQYYPANGTFAGNVAISNVSAAFGAVFANTTFINVPIKPPVNTNYNLLSVAVIDDSGANSAPVVYTQMPSKLSTTSYFTDDEFSNFPISTNAFKRDLPFYLEIKAQDTLTGAASRVFTTAQLNVDRSNTVSVVDVATFGAGAQFLFAGVTNVSVVQGTTYLNITPQAEIITHDLTGADKGIYILEAAVTPAGTLTGNTYSIGMRSNAEAVFSNTTATIRVAYPGGGASYNNISSGAGIVPQIVDNQEIILDSAILANVFPGQVSDDMEASNIRLWMQGFNNLGNVSPAIRAMGDQKINFYKISKNIID
jgi:hypothetical protein